MCFRFSFFLPLPPPTPPHPHERAPSLLLTRSPPPVRPLNAPTLPTTHTHARGRPGHPPRPAPRIAPPPPPNPRHPSRHECCNALRRRHRRRSIARPGRCRRPGAGQAVAALCVPVRDPAPVQAGGTVSRREREGGRRGGVYALFVQPSARASAGSTVHPPHTHTPPPPSIPLSPSLASSPGSKPSPTPGPSPGPRTPSATWSSAAPAPGLLSPARAPRPSFCRATWTW